MNSSGEINPQSATNITSKCILGCGLRDPRPTSSLDTSPSPLPGSLMHCAWDPTLEALMPHRAGVLWPGAQPSTWHPATLGARHPLSASSMMASAPAGPGRCPARCPGQELTTLLPGWTALETKRSLSFLPTNRRVPWSTAQSPELAQVFHCGNAASRGSWVHRTHSKRSSVQTAPFRATPSTSGRDAQRCSAGQRRILEFLAIEREHPTKK